MIKLYKYKLYLFSKEKASGFIEKIYEIPTTCCVLYRNQAETFRYKPNQRINGMANSGAINAVKSPVSPMARPAKAPARLDIWKAALVPMPCAANPSANPRTVSFSKWKMR